ncbi:MAG: 2-C-methyl-D-erythritol 2,4-cyclodiphosphate synthase, partial [Nitrospinaceae bacterium]|nr:2-C-methyl-D-erythritol 2,4-cyclodiphosphate synthase [Nitrospinaceae bacterium]NIR56734.1 2-C-methyl-D-erythritol 2,4-cyclodiphosphate synthase [Nitrospinaceae bacterium]NIS87183.1 2-C-methyl-D-erythritol 2,4-cyclodiphosphate synthase [Nitrospinaceae bacterium]NIT84052.1 2-C-methyl-D-erythritol 2,4-cyclodiphosphate synthase [Nitrospinaceae bacterium]NIU46235.1 2-C-methyl-D-erythritol 2,4-cyclodiphosphate synthase [Nitrospinaceae bacterium]
MYRIGNGYDVHRLVDGRKLILGGVEIPHPRGLQGHSDADALVHALCDAILGACGGGDLGAHFPDSDPQWKDVSSLVLLQKVGDVCARRGFRIVNLDTILVAQEPKVAPYLKEMQTRLARTLGLQPGQINLKATTTEHLGFTGREEGIAAYA